MMFSPRPRVNEPERARIPTAAFPDATPGLYPDSYRRPAPPSIDPEHGEVEFPVRFPQPLNT